MAKLLWPLYFFGGECGAKNDVPVSKTDVTMMEIVVLVMVSESAKPFAKGEVEAFLCPEAVEGKASEITEL